MTRIALIAFFFLAAGAARPAFLLAEAFLPKAQQEIALEDQDLSDGEGQEDATDSSESDTEDDVLKIMADGMTIAPLHTAEEQAFTAYSLVFREHHPEVITPPPKA